MKCWTKFVRDEEAKKFGTMLYSNNRYHVTVYRHQNQTTGGPDIIHISLRSNDRSARLDWRDLQRIKNEFFGPDHEAVEVFPTESNLVDLCNQFHIWAFEDQHWLSKLGLGFQDGRRVSDGSEPMPKDALLAEQGVGYSNAKQRPF